MVGRMSRPSETLLARAALALYPAAWRGRYGDEVLGLLDDSGGGLGAVASIAWQALPMWVCPPGHLHDADARMRASISTVFAAWSFLTGLALVFVMFTQQQGFAPPDHPVVGWSYGVFDVTLAASVLVIVAGSVPLWLALLRQALRERRRLDLAYLVVPVAVPAAYLAAGLGTLALVHHPEASGPWWFIGFTIAGFAAAGVSAGGPILALKRMSPRGPAVRLAVRTAGLAAAAIAAAGLASGIAATGLCLWSPGFAAYHDRPALGCYLALIIVGTSVAAVSAARGTRAVLVRPAR
jgi:hypothetical protein